MHRKRLFFFLLCIFFAAAALSALPVRSITTAETDFYSYDETALRFEEAVILQFDNGLSGVVKAEWEDSPNDTIIRGSLGIVFPLFTYAYNETAYGLAVGEDTVEHIILNNLYYERDRYYLIFSTQLELSETQTTFMPSLAAKWKATGKLALWGKYSSAFDSDAGFDHSFWGEASYDVVPKWTFIAGGTVGSYHADADSASALEYSFLGGLSFLPRDRCRFTYRFEYLTRQQYEKSSHSLVADIQF